MSFSSFTRESVLRDGGEGGDNSTRVLFEEQKQICLKEPMTKTPDGIPMYGSNPSVENIAVLQADGNCEVKPTLKQQICF